MCVLSIGSTGATTQLVPALQQFSSVFHITLSDLGQRRGAATVTWALIETPEYVGTLTISRPHVILQLERCQDRTILMRKDNLQIAGYFLLPLASTSWIYIYRGRRRRRQQQQLVPRPYQRGLQVHIFGGNNYVRHDRNQRYMDFVVYMAPV